MALPSPRARSSEIIDDGKRPFTVCLDVTPHATYAVVAAPDKRKAGFICPCDLSVVQAWLMGWTTAIANATFRFKLGSATVATWTGTKPKVFVSGLKFGGTNGPDNTFFDLFATTNGLATGWCKLVTKRVFFRGNSIIATVTGTTAAAKTQKFGLMLVCVPR